jgi:hypothetical protein
VSAVKVPKELSQILWNQKILNAIMGKGPVSETETRIAEVAGEVSRLWEENQVKARQGRAIKKARRAGNRAMSDNATGTRVYFIQAGIYGPIKIGHTSTSVATRRDNMQVGCPEVLYLLGTLPGGPELEAELHARFAEHHLRGEWFNLNNPLLALIATCEDRNFNAAT